MKADGQQEDKPSVTERRDLEKASVQVCRQKRKEKKRALQKNNRKEEKMIRGGCQEGRCGREALALLCR